MYTCSQRRSRGCFTWLVFALPLFLCHVILGTLSDALIDADIFDAAYRGNANALRIMISRGASINAMGAYGQYPLFTNRRVLHRL